MQIFSYTVDHFQDIHVVVMGKVVGGEIPSVYLELPSFNWVSITDNMENYTEFGTHTSLEIHLCTSCYEKFDHTAMVVLASKEEWGNVVLCGRNTLHC